MIESTPGHSAPLPSPAVMVRCVVGGILMGLANLVPGISGGTMLLAAGAYPEFVDSVAAITTLRRRLRPWIIAALVVGPAVIAIGVLAGSIRDAVLEHRWVAFSLFIGLTLGGVPTLWRMLRPISVASGVGGGVAVIAMAALAIVQEATPTTDPGGGSLSGLPGLFVGGFAGAAAMVLPGVSGGYLLLLLGQYVAVLDAISSFTDAAKAGDMAALGSALVPIMSIGLGVLLGVVLVSNLIRWLLHRFREATLGVLLGLLLGAVAGLWPFRESVPPEVGSEIRGEQIESVEQAQAVPLKRWPTARFTPSGGQVVGACGLILLGFGMSWMVGRIGGKGEEPAGPAEPSG
ncbi:MAG: DUF368 domain-containing protein [Phycisphaerales bacterium]|nr:DUF368 domain-containing protein [Phycisphaerales bacterium]